ncbi:Hypothetical predicted protein, partial [Podarcis lilfordi]
EISFCGDYALGLPINGTWMNFVLKTSPAFGSPIDGPPNWGGVFVALCGDFV